MSECYVKLVNFKKFFESIGVSSELMLTGKEFQAAGPAWLKQRSPNFVECSVWRSRQCWRTSDRVYGWIQRLTVQSQPSTVVHVQCGSGASMHTTCTWFCTPKKLSFSKTALKRWTKTEIRWNRKLVDRSSPVLITNFPAEVVEKFACRFIQRTQCFHCNWLEVILLLLLLLN